MPEKGKSVIDNFVAYAVTEKRVEAKLSQSELAALLNVSNGFIGQVESRKFSTKYSIKQLNDLAKIFNCSPKDFLPDTPL